MMRRLDLEVANHSKNSPDKVTVDTSGDSNCCACRIACITQADPMAEVETTHVTDCYKDRKFQSPIHATYYPSDVIIAKLGVPICDVTIICRFSQTAYPKQLVVIEKPA